MTANDRINALAKVSIEIKRKVEEGKVEKNVYKEFILAAKKIATNENNEDYAKLYTICYSCLFGVLTDIVSEVWQDFIKEENKNNARNLKTNKNSTRSTR